MNKELRLTIKTKDLIFLNNLFENQKLSKGTSVTMQEVITVSVDSIKKKTGISDTEIILNVIISIEANIFSAYLKDILDIFNNKGESIIQDSVTKEEIITKEDITKYK